MSEKCAASYESASKTDKSLILDQVVAGWPECLINAGLVASKCGDTAESASTPSPTNSTDDPAADSNSPPPTKYYPNPYCCNDHPKPP